MLRDPELIERNNSHARCRQHRQANYLPSPFRELIVSKSDFQTEPFWITWGDE
jgi:hypothetical protein